jgi:hypothetical protein
MDADFFLRTSEGPTFEVIIESSGSGKKNGDVVHRNPDYKEAFETVLARISEFASTLDDCLVDSTTVHRKGLNEDERRVLPSPPFSYPIDLRSITDFGRLRLALTGPQTVVGSKARTGGNSTKRVLLKFTSRQGSAEMAEIIAVLKAEEVGENKKSRRDITVGVGAADIEAAMAEWRTIGPSAFHEKYGTNPANRYVIVDPDGTEFDAKAVLIGARRHAGLKGQNEEFRGDRTTVEVPLSRLGFVVEDLTIRDGDEETTDELPPPESQARAIEQAQQFAGKTDAMSLRAVRREQKTLRWALGLGIGSSQCAICGRTLPSHLLVAAHIKKRSECTESERIDIPSVAFVACTLGCDTLYEHGYISVDVKGRVIALRKCPDRHLEDAVSALVGRSVDGWSESSANYFAWHREYWGSQFT